MEGYGTLEQDLIRSVHYCACAKLGSSSTSTVRMKNGRPAITDGPFAETKEQIGGYHLIEVPAFDQGLRQSAKSGTGGKVHLA